MCIQSIKIKIEEDERNNNGYGDLWNPKVEVIEVEVEKGFAVSIESVGETYEDIEW